jgi:integrase
MKNPNHPKRGSSITVEPLRSLRDIENIRTLLAPKPRDLLLFNIGVNSPLRVGELLKLKVAQVRSLKLGDTLSFLEVRTGKASVLPVSKSIHQALVRYLEESKPTDSEYLFRSRKGKNQPLSVGSVNALVKGWAKALNLSGNFGAHTLRKTFGYVQRTYYGVGFEVLARCFNHSRPSTTMRYLGLKNREVDVVVWQEV